MTNCKINIFSFDRFFFVSHLTYFVFIEESLIKDSLRHIFAKSQFGGRQCSFYIWNVTPDIQYLHQGQYFPSDYFLPIPPSWGGHPHLPQASMAMLVCQGLIVRTVLVLER